MARLRLWRPGVAYSSTSREILQVLGVYTSPAGSARLRGLRCHPLCRGFGCNLQLSFNPPPSPWRFVTPGPDIATDCRGTWAVVSPAHAYSSMCQVRVSLSMNNGVSWSDGIPLAAPPGTAYGADVHPRIFADRSGNWYLTCEAEDLPPTGSTRILVASSPDAFRWNEPVGVYGDSLRGSSKNVHPAIAADGSGRVVVVWSSNALAASRDAEDFDILFTSAVEPARECAQEINGPGSLVVAQPARSRSQ